MSLLYYLLLSFPIAKFSKRFLNIGNNYIRTNTCNTTFLSSLSIFIINGSKAKKIREHYNSPILFATHCILGQEGDVFKSTEEEDKWLVEKVHQAGTHVTLEYKIRVAERIGTISYLKVQVDNFKFLVAQR